MRLIDTETGFFVDFPDFSTAPPYAILSHTWDPKGEQTYQEVREIQERFKRNDDPSPFPMPSIWDPVFGLLDKVRMACEVARRDGFRYIWIDSCCIDKTSSSELSEAINSMYNWYRDAQICYAFLSDVPSQSDSDDPRAYGSRFRSSRWFTRGWTLQELVAPRWVLFLSVEWTLLGTKDTLASVIEAITRIDSSVLRQEKSLDSASVAQRMSWAAARQTTRVEDQAYSLLGIFGINMPTLYGEGEQAFRRLQEEILKKIPDQTMFAWGDHPWPATAIQQK
ncbi:heterokaryon incompatibility protein-domain-containing protein [Ganoderma leucocontextum]|nr:heterokaryon incompatibility protein-domain-containing protein [Ganoderma leucocontextum]